MGKKKEIGLRIRTMRKSRGMTQEDLAKAIGQSASSITMYETGRRSPDFETLEALADIFNVSLASLVSEDEPSENKSGDKIEIVVTDSEMFSKILYYMSPADYDIVMDKFNETYKKMKAMGVEL